MNILYHHRTQSAGAAGQHIKEMIKAFTMEGHAVDICSPAGAGDSFEVRSDVPKKNRYRIPQLIFELFEILYNVVDFARLSVQLKKKVYGLIYERYAIFNIAGVMSAKMSGIPIILEVSFTSKTAVFPKRTKLLFPIARLVDRYVFGMADRIVVVSSVLKKSLIDDFGTDEGKIIVAHNAVDPAMFDPEVSGSQIRSFYGLGSSRIVGFVGGFYPWHGLNFLLSAAGTLAERCPDVRFVLVGDGPMGDRLKKYVESSALKDKVIFTGSVPHKDIPRYVSIFDVGVMPDSNSYGSPIKIFEYMSMRKPVIAPRIGPIQEVIEDGVNGFLFDRNNKEELVSAIIRLLSDSELYKKIADNSRKRILEKHTWRKNAESILRIL